MNRDLQSYYNAVINGRRVNAEFNIEEARRDFEATERRLFVGR